MENDELFYYLALQSVVGIGPVNAKKLLESLWRSQANFIKQSTNDLRGNQRFKHGCLMEQLKSTAIFEKAEKEMRFIEANSDLSLNYRNMSLILPN